MQLFISIFSIFQYISGQNSPARTYIVVFTSYVIKKWFMTEMQLAALETTLMYANCQLRY